MEKMLPIEADLTVLRSQLPTKRRQSRRFRCNLATMAKLRTDDSPDPKTTWAYNLSTGGVGLNVPEPIDAGRHVTIQFRVSEKDVKTVPARVVFCRQEIDQSWRVGCAFIEPISQDLMDALLG